MSTTVETPVVSGFETPEVAKLPRLACVGTVAEVGEAKGTKNGEGILSYIPIKLEGIRGSRGVTFNYFFVESFFRPGFSTKELAGMAVKVGDEVDEKGGDKLVRRFGQSIVAPAPKPTLVEKKTSVGILEGLAGSQEALNNFAQLRDETYAVLHPQGGEFTREEIRDLLAKFLLQENAGQQVGFYLKQRQEKIEGAGENGGDAYVRADGYELDRMFIYDDPSAGKGSNVERVVKAAANSKGGTKVTFEIE